MVGPFPILIAEDDENDAFILKRALRSAGFDNPFHICPNGLDVVRYLKGDPPYENREKHPFPRILITDLKMPQMDGFELLTWIQKHPECNLIPRLVLSASQQDADIIRAYQLGVNSYLVKPATYDALVASLKVVFAYWTVCEKPPLPPKC